MKEYKKLSKIILDNQERLSEKILGLSLITENETIKNACVEYVGMLTQKGNEYMNQLSLLEQDLLSPVLKIMDVLYATDSELGQSGSSCIGELDETIQNKCQKRRKRRLQKELGKSFAGIAAGTVLASLLKPSAFGVILLGSVVSVIVSGVLYEIYMKKTNNKDESEANQSVLIDYHLTAKDIDNIIKGLISVGESVDTVLLTYRSHLEILQDECSRKMESYSLEKKYIGILECFQSILGNLTSGEDTPIVQDSRKQLNNSLVNYGFKVLHYSKGNESCFDVEYDNCIEPDEFKPAIVKMYEGKEILVLRGKVVLPKEL